ncbi:MAG: hypothetical protein HY892_12370 [Deltaproteobacteria bacterium]|nr:hypothetical protein [Deltaproteobacteria bacterium]
MEHFAKFTPPRPSGIVPRRRLFRLLDDLLSHPILWVSGPAGSGKTSLAASYLKENKAPALWYQMDSRDGDIATFFYYLSLAAKKASPRKKGGLPLLTSEYLKDITTFARRFFEQLFNRLNKNSFLVFDNYQEVAAESLLHLVIHQALTVIPPEIKVVLLSRQMPPGDLIRFRANDLLGLITWQDLRLDIDESVEISGRRRPEGLSLKDVEHLHRAVDGWVAGLVLTLESMKLKPLDLQEVSSHPPEEIFEYFASEVFSKSDPELQTFLLRTAFLPKFTVEMAHQLTGMTEASQILASLSKKGFFTAEHGHQTPQYEYHPLFQRFLISRARQTFSMDVLEDLRTKGASLLEAAGQIEAAVELFQEIKRWDRLIPLILKYAPLMVSQGRDRPLEQWLRSLPPEDLERNGWLLYWLGVSLITVDLSASRRTFEEAFELFEIRKDISGQLSAWSGIVSAILYAQDDFSLLDKWMAWLDSQVSLPLRLPQPELDGMLVTSMMGALTYRQPSHPKIDQWIREGDRIANDHPNAYFRMRANIYLGVYFFWTGNFAMVRHHVQRVQESASGLQDLHMLRICSKWADSHYFFFHQPEGEACQRTALDGLDIAQSTGIHLLDMQLYGNLIMGFLSDGNLLDAGRHLDAMGSAMQGSYRRAYYYYLASWQAWLNRDLPKALHHIEQALNLIIASGMPSVEVSVRAAFAELLFEAGKSQEADSQLAIANRKAELLGGDYFVLICGLTQARLALAGNGRPEALNSLRKALAVGRTQKLFNNYWWVPAWMTALCLKALEEGIEAEYVQELVRRRFLFPDRPPYHCQNWPWELKIHTLGRFEIIRDGEALYFPVKAPKRVLLLLKALIACGARGSSEEQLAQFLWPEAEGDMALQSLATTLHRLRQLLGKDGAIVVRDGWVSLNSRKCWVDAHVFEELLQRMEEQAGSNASFLQKGSQKENYQPLESALNLYQGVFLKDLNEPWAISYRDRLRRKFARDLLQLGENLKNAGAFEKAAAWFEKGLEADELEESFYLGLMTCHQARGRSAEALAVYQRCDKIMKSKLNAHLS